MEIGAVSTALNASQPPYSPAAETATQRLRQVSRDGGIDPARRQDAGTNSPTRARGDGERGAIAHPARETPNAAKAQAAETKANIQFKDADGTQVMEVYDSKEVLIYQVPPKGVLMLIQAQESQEKSQIEAQA